jgi:HEPN domain-containing protein
MSYKTAYINISNRHLDMAEILEKEGYYEGAVFHAYHAFEAICCAGLEELSDGLEHDRRLLMFNPYPENFQRKFFRVYQILSALTDSRTPVGTRNKSLYYEKIEPHKRFQAKDARTVIERVDEIVNLIIPER